MNTTQRGGPRAVLFDRDGTLVADVPWNTDPDRVQAMPTVVDTLDVLRAADIRIGVVSNQAGIGLGLQTFDDLDRINRRIDELMGPFDVWCVCPHVPDSGCGCRKPDPGLIITAAEQLGIAPCEMAVVGDIGADVEAAARAGARAVLVPTAVTRWGEIVDAPLVAADLRSAVEALFGGLPEPSRGGAGRRTDITERHPTYAHRNGL